MKGLCPYKTGTLEERECHFDGYCNIAEFGDELEKLLSAQPDGDIEQDKTRSQLRRETEQC